MKQINVTGQRFGKLRVLGSAPSAKGKARWYCVCDCGNELLALGRDLRNGSTFSCGCARVHGHANRGRKSPEYLIWMAMKQRCPNPKHHDYKNYGGRGIRVCERWLESFENFLADMGPRPEGKGAGGRSLYSIERKNNDANYAPENCIWATAEQQLANQRPRLSGVPHGTDGRFQKTQVSLEVRT